MPASAKQAEQRPPRRRYRHLASGKGRGSRCGFHRCSTQNPASWIFSPRSRLVSRSRRKPVTPAAHPLLAGKRNSKKLFCKCKRAFLVGDGGFEPPKALPADLQSVPFGHSGNPPYAIGLNLKADGAGRRTRTPDLLITNQLLYQLSYTSDSNEHGYYTPGFWNCQALFFSFAKIRFSKNLPVSACPGRAGADSGRGIIPDSASGAAAPS